MVSVQSLLLHGAFLFFAAFFFSVITVLVTQLVRISKSPSHIPWVGLKNRWILPKLRACLSELKAGRSMIDEGYNKYGKYGKPFILPGMMWNAVVLPPSNASWVAHQSDSILSGTTILDDVMGLKHITHGPTAESCRDFTVIRRDLTRQILKLSDQIYDEVRAALDEELEHVGEDDWKNVKLQEVISNVSFRTGNRIFVGLPMCRDKAYKRAVDRWTQAFGISTMLVRFLIPENLRDLFLRAAAIPTRLFERRAANFFIREIKDRLTALGKAEKQANNDMMQWIIHRNATKNDWRELEPQNIAGKMILFNIFATATIGVQTGITLLELLSSAELPSLLPELHAEACETMSKILEDPRNVRDMVKIDSLIRETIRYHPMTPQGLVRQVVKPGGLMTPDGVYLPEGTYVHSLVRHMHHDAARFGEGADSFDPLRHYKQVNAEGLSRPYGDDLHYQEAKQKAAVQASSEFLSWGLGRHACPGRFFAVHVMKLLLGYLFVNYDFQPLLEKPKVVEFADMEVLSEKAVVRMKRRTGSRAAEPVDG